MKNHNQVTHKIDLLIDARVPRTKASILRSIEPRICGYLIRLKRSYTPSEFHKATSSLGWLENKNSFILKNVEITFELIK